MDSKTNVHLLFLLGDMSANDSGYFKTRKTALFLFWQKDKRMKDNDQHNAMMKFKEQFIFSSTMTDILLNGQGSKMEHLNFFLSIIDQVTEKKNILCFHETR